MENNILIYTTKDGNIDVKLEQKTVWLTQKQMSKLFDTTPQNITIPIQNIYKEQELSKDSTCKDFLQVQTDLPCTQREISFP